MLLEGAMAIARLLPYPMQSQIWQHRFLGSCGSWNHCLKKGRANGGEKWIGWCPQLTIWLSWSQPSKMVPMATPWRYFCTPLVLRVQYMLCSNLRSSFLIMEQIMTPKARADIHVNLPALQKLDSMLIETLDSMVNTEFWYAEGGSRAEGRNKGERQSKRWWLPSPQVPSSGISDNGRKKLICQGSLVHQVLKAAKSINENVLLEMPVPTIIRDALPKSGKASLGDDLFKVLSAETTSTEDIFRSLGLKSEHDALECINRLEAAALTWKEKIAEQVNGKSPTRTSWSFIKDPISELDKMEWLLDRAESLIKYLKTKYPNLPNTFLDVTKIQYGKDVGHLILEAYSRSLRNVAFSILSRIQDILQEDSLSNPNSPAISAVSPCFSGLSFASVSDSPIISRQVRHSLIDQMNRAEARCSDLSAMGTSDVETSCGERKTSSVTATPCRNRGWCIRREACSTVSPTSSP
ncbi:hypothetical protein ACJRO7_019965 [Eucalyptus globulus]|uniref:PRONE domain-containing protein n=1 Tax=Eucalyptus globulus TaxID=34317 RepID=A0ABD3KK63_EUCGL